MNLLAFDFAAHHFTLRVDVELQLVHLAVNAHDFSVKPLDIVSIHEFEHPTLGVLCVDAAFDLADHKVSYQLVQQGAVVTQGLADLSEVAVAALVESKAFVTALEPSAQVQSKPLPSKSGMVLLGVGIKLLKTVKVIKIALMAATVAVYSVMFTFEFAIALVGVLVFHEYGHLRAMKKS